MADPMPTAPMTDARLDEIQAAADQYKAKREAAQNALIDHDRSEVLRQEAYAASLAQVFAEEYGPEMAAEIRRLRAENAEREQDAATAWRHSSAVDERVREAMQEITRTFERLVDRLNAPEA